MRRIAPTKVLYLVVHACLVLLGFFLWREDSALQQSVGASLIAAGLTGSVVFVYIFFAQTTRQRFEDLSELGILRGFPRRGPAIKEEYDRLIARSSKRIDILGFGLRSLREDYGGDFSVWKTRSAVRILLVDPGERDSGLSYANLRDAEEGNPVDSIASDVRQFLEATTEIRDERFQVRLFSCLPSINIFRVDDQLFWGPYFLGKQSRNTPTFLVKRAGLLFAPICEHFEEIWSKHSRDADEWLSDEQQQ